MIRKGKQRSWALRIVSFRTFVANPRSYRADKGRVLNAGIPWATPQKLEKESNHGQIHLSLIACSIVGCPEAPNTPGVAATLLQSQVHHRRVVDNQRVMPGRRLPSNRRSRDFRTSVMYRKRGNHCLSRRQESLKPRSSVIWPSEPKAKHVCLQSDRQPQRWEQQP